MVPRSRKTSRFGSRSKDGERRGFDPERVRLAKNISQGSLAPCASTTMDGRKSAAASIRRISIRHSVFTAMAASRVTPAA